MTTRAVIEGIFLAATAAALALDVHISKLGRRHPFEDSYLSLPFDEGHKLLARGRATPRGRKLRWVRHVLTLCLAGAIIAWFITQ
jgi:hypothetical protein